MIPGARLPRGRCTLRFFVEDFAMRKRWYCAAAVVAVALVLLVADSASAQRRLRGRRNGGYYGNYNNGPMYYGGYGYGPGYYGAGYGGLYGPTYYGTGYGGIVSGPVYGPGLMMADLTNAPIVGTDTTSFYYQPGRRIGIAGSGVDSRSALIEVLVPPDAQVSFDGDTTSQTGPNRLFSSPPLDRGQAYHYTVTARFTQNGRPVEQTRRVEVRAGQRTTVNFLQDQGQDRDLDRGLNRNRDRIQE
jgi:uncharacterized protein (TIGR03000 family)